ncbi:MULTISPECIES: hypothetical protein [unclassified Rhizobium]|uniref:hypothetical protein n=1 Tax=unclassified Rhizobium TaxID=2613769 RepID=UPI00288AE220|nr:MULTISPECIES: hypothetical protein [unclassified Rhizobium]
MSARQQREITRYPADLEDFLLPEIYWAFTFAVQFRHQARNVFSTRVILNFARRLGGFCFGSRLPIWDDPPEQLDEVSPRSDHVVPGKDGLPVAIDGVGSG